ncbi:glycoside hydrolase family 20 protein [Sabulilitoribacter arenilitoris]|uniref:beta-N-acetylhexosaminidase n=1 Tax=Wocania arenilitoris TaxID=2044858 RepID=A0AAE3ELY2_9FLAO|nr:glycoside hydrolase family 20 protein [Wocania arenilitoris]MCF7567841.1 glycoside hydrolase family 20 protein [Wocania arenilitoris]
MKLKVLLIVALSLVIFSCNTNETKVFTESDIQVIPKPETLKLKEGHFKFTENTVFYVTDDIQLRASQILIDRFKTAQGWDLKTVKTQPKSNFIQFKTSENIGKEAYKLIVENDVITIESKGYNGLLYAIQTLRQLLPTAIESQTKVADINWVIPNLEITDKPRFQWRGLMLDVSRHFFQKEYIKKTIDRLAYHKMNTLHLHLVDDQGWRIEIKKYPKLTEVGAFRVDQEDKPWNGRYTPELDEKATYGGFYTQEDIKEIVAYAESRGVTVVPEIEMPAHVTSAIASYPEFSCLEKPVPVPSGGLWPITDIYCAGKESTFEFLEDVLVEVMALFPSKYIHVGGDEATKTNWKTCAHCKKRMKDEKLKSVEELQSYFIKRMERFISSKGRVLIGWDEILEGGLAPGATVMSWRGVKGGLEASEQGHDVVMTPGSHCYFDHYQGPMDTEPKAWGGYSPVSKVYQFDPIVDTMSDEQAKHVLGGQANLWSEYVTTESHSEYMIYPRIAALSEALWSPKPSRNWVNFSSRLENLFKRYEHQNINYAKSAYTITSETEVNDSMNTISVALKNEFPVADIRYVLNESSLDEAAIKYTKPIEINSTSTIKASLFKDNKPVGKVFEKTFNYHKAVGKKVIYNIKYHDSYKGKEASNMVNIVRGTKNFHDGQWQAWLVKDMDLTIDLDELTDVSSVSVGTMESQGPSIYFPTQVEVLLSNDGKTFSSVGKIDRPFESNANIILKDFVIGFDTQKAQFIRVKAKNLGKTERGGATWIFIDEIIVQ